MIVDEKKNEVGQIFNFRLSSQQGSDWPQMGRFVQLIKETEIVKKWHGSVFSGFFNTLEFGVNAKKHNGKVIINSNGHDFFNVYLADDDNLILSVKREVYLDDLISTIDHAIRSEY